MMGRPSSTWFLLALGAVAEVRAQDPPSALEIRCVDERGAPVAKADVWLFQRMLLPDGSDDYRPFGPFTTGAEGIARCEVSLTYSGGRSDRFAYARVPNRLVGAARSFVGDVPAASTPSRIDVRMLPSREVRGVVHVPDTVDPAIVRVSVLSMHVLDGTSDLGAPMPRSQTMNGLRASLPDRFECQAGKDGSFVLRDVPVRVRLYLAAEGEGLGQAQYSNLQRPGGWVTVPDLVELKMQAECVLSGLVTAPDGSPLPMANVTAQMCSSGRTFGVLSRFEAAADVAGVFRLRGLPAATFDVSVDCPAEVGCLRPLRIETRAGQPLLDFALRLEEGVPVAGVVVDERDGAPLPEAGVMAITDDSGAKLAYALSDLQGRFWFRLPHGGAHLYFAAVPKGYEPPQRQIVQEIQIAGPNPALAKLRLSLARRGQPHR